MPLCLQWDTPPMMRFSLIALEHSCTSMKKQKRNGGQWTQSRFESFIKSALRAATRRWPQKHQALKDACVGKKLNRATGKEIFHYKCAGCGKLFKGADVAVDHIEPVVNPKTGFVSWDVYIERMFCEADGFQVLCHTCHGIKTQNEREERKRCKSLT